MKFTDKDSFKSGKDNVYAILYDSSVVIQMINDHDDFEGAYMILKNKI